MRKTPIITIIVLALMALFALSQPLSANDPHTKHPQKQLNKHHGHTPKTPTPQNQFTTKEKDYIDQLLLKEEVKSYEKQVSTLWGALTIIVALIGLIYISIAYILFKNRGEYKEAVADARQACDKAERWEEKAREKLESIDTAFDKKLQEIKEESAKTLKEISTQREISELWAKAFRAANEKDYETAADLFSKIALDDDIDANDRAYAYNNWGATFIERARLGGPEAEHRFEEACQKCKKATDIKPDYHKAHINWGAALAYQAKLGGLEAEHRFEEAYRKYEEAVRIKPDDHRVYSGWGFALLSWAAKTSEGPERKGKLAEAEKKLLKAEYIRKGSASYNLACVYGLRNDKETCKQWLKNASEAGTLPTKEQALKDDDLKIVHDEPWFNKLNWKE